jgi:hypothetical protein
MRDLARQDLDAGAHTIAWHQWHRNQVMVSAATINRCLAGPD